MKSHHPPAPDATAPEVLELLYPSSKTALMQQLQTLVLRGNVYWIGGVVPREKLQRLALKMALRYPVTRSERGRTYDRARGVASAHLIVFPVHSRVAWWVLTSVGEGGLADAASEDAQVAKQALARDGHIAFGDYVLLYAHKEETATLTDARTKRPRRIVRKRSTLTWRMREPVLAELRAVLAAEVAARRLGAGVVAGSERSPGVLGFLARQRRRPLFAGVRSQVLALHREARDAWARVHQGSAGRIAPLDVAANLPKMVRVRVFAEPTCTVKSLTA